jgi:hypothetical protein
MNAAIDNHNLYPLPAVLFRAPAPFGRRHRIDDHEIGETELTLFNELLLRLDLRRQPLARDQLVSAARELADDTDGPRAPPCIHQRMRHAGAIDRMLRDAAWRTAETLVAPARLLVRYVREGGGLIPDGLPKVGRLDDSILVDAAWTSLAGEVRSYLDYRRLRQLERGLGNEAGFGRDEWEVASVAEIRLARHHRRVGENSYLDSDQAIGFHVC